MATLTEGKHSAEFLLTEGVGNISRDEVTLKASAGALVPGTLLGKVTATGFHAAYSNSASDGTEVAVAILYHAAPNKAATQKATVIARHAEVIQSQLTGADSAGLVDLKALQIIAR